MKYTIQLDIGYDEKHWDLATFYHDREAFYLRVLDAVAPNHGEIVDCGLHFKHGTRSLAKALVDIAKRNDFSYWIAVGPKYSSEEIRQARFVPLLTSGEIIDDDDRDGVALNMHQVILCRACGNPDEAQVPIPYRVNKRLMLKRPEIYGGSNGIHILSASGLDKLMPLIGEYVIHGPAVVTDRGIPIAGQTDYFWIRPTCVIGPYVDAKVLQTCPKCGRPTEIRRVESDDIFERNKRVVTSFQGLDAPIALVGNWFGETAADQPFSNSHDVVISGALHEKIRRMKLKGFVEADYLIHAADEPGHEPPE